MISSTVNSAAGMGLNAAGAAWLSTCVKFWDEGQVVLSVVQPEPVINHLIGGEGGA